MSTYMQYICSLSLFPSLSLSRARSAFPCGPREPVTPSLDCAADGPADPFSEGTMALSAAAGRGPVTPASFGGFPVLADVPRSCRPSIACRRAQECYRARSHTHKHPNDAGKPLYVLIKHAQPLHGVPGLHDRLCLCVCVCVCVSVNVYMY